MRRPWSGAASTISVGSLPLTIDYVNPEHPWPEVKNLRNSLGDIILEERLCIYPKYIAMKWYSDELEPLINRLLSGIESRQMSGN